MSKRLGNKSPYVTSTPRSFNCGYCYKPTPTPKPLDKCPLLPKDTPYQLCSPWPQNGGIYNTNTRLSPFPVSPNASLFRQSPFDGGTIISFAAGLIFRANFNNTPIIDKDGNIYITSTVSLESGGALQKNGLFIVTDKNGTITNQFDLIGQPVGASCIGSDGFVYFTTVLYGDIIGFPNNKSNLCAYKIGFTSPPIIIYKDIPGVAWGSPSIDNYGNVCFISTDLTPTGLSNVSNLNIYNIKSKKLRSYEVPGVANANISIDKNGTYYFTSFFNDAILGIKNGYLNIYKKDSPNTESIDILGGPIGSTPAIDNNNDIVYVLSSIGVNNTSYIYTYNIKSQNLQTPVTLSDIGSSFGSPAMDKDGTIYFTSTIFNNSGISTNDSFLNSYKYGFTPQKISVVGNTLEAFPSIDANGYVYFASFDTTKNDSYLNIYKDGSIKKRIYIEGSSAVSSPSINSNGWIYLFSNIVSIDGNSALRTNQSFLNIIK